MPTQSDGHQSLLPFYFYLFTFAFLNVTTLP